MRIISGEFRGRKLAAPPGLGTRPMLDRVREAIFSTVAPWFGDPLVLDLFAGSGSLGLEALSRGARRVRFAERDPAAREILERNVRELGVQERVEFTGGDALEPVTWGTGPYDVVFLDPPFPTVRSSSGRRELAAALELLFGSCVDGEAVGVLHVPRGTLSRGELPGGLLSRESEYGAQSIWYLQRES